MSIALIILFLVWGIPMILYIVWKRGDWYLFLFPMFLSTVICFVLAVISDVLSICFSIMAVIYIVYNLTNKKARQIRNEIKKEREYIYEEYKKEEVDNQVTFKNYVLPSGKKVEYIDFNTKTFYLLRPYEEHIEIKYKRQVQKYVNELESIYGGNWICIIDTY